MFQALLAVALAFSSGAKAVTIPNERKTYIQNVRIVEVSTAALSGGSTVENMTYVMDVNAFGLILSTSVAYTNQSNTFTSSQTIRDGTKGGLLVDGDSVTASAFFGDGSHLTGITASFSGGNVTNTTTFQSSVTVNDGVAGGLLVRGDSVTASAFFGDGSHLTGVSASFTGGGVANQTTFFSSVTILGANGLLVSGTSVTAGAFFGDGSHLTGIVTSGGISTGAMTTAALSGNGQSSSPLGVVSSSVAVLNSSGFVQNFQIDPASVTKQGFVSLANLSGAVPSGRVDFSTITTALGTKAGSGANSDITSESALRLISSEVTHTSSMTISDGTGGGFLVRGDSITASSYFGDGSHLSGIVSSGSVILSGASAGGDLTGTYPNPTLKATQGNITVLSNLATISSVLTMMSSVTVQDGAGGFGVPGGSVTASAFFGDGSHLTGISASFTGGGVANATTFFSSTTIQDGVKGGLLVAGDSVTAGAYFGDGSHLTGITASFTGGNVANTTTFQSSVTINGVGGLLINQGGVIASSGSFVNGVTASSLTITNGNITIPKANGVGQGTSGSTMSVTGSLYFVSSNTITGSTFTANNVNTNFSTFTLLANTISIGDGIEVECAFRNKGTITTPVQGVILNTPAATFTGAVTTDLNRIIVFARLRAWETGALQAYGTGLNIATTGIANILATTTGSMGDIPFDMTANQVINCYGKSAGGGTVDFLWMKVNKW